MTTEPVRLERRAGQRFELHLPVAIRCAGRSASGFSQNVSARGIFVYTETVLAEGDAVELTFTMPCEITLAESMRVRCLGRVLRALASSAGQRNGVAVHLHSYEYLTDSSLPSAAGLTPISPVHPQPESTRLINR